MTAIPRTFEPHSSTHGTNKNYPDFIPAMSKHILPGPHLATCINQQQAKLLPFYIYILLSAFLITGCNPNIEYNGPIMKSSTEDLSEKLILIENMLAKRGYPVHELNPGLTREEIDRKVSSLSYPFPEELYQLYMWRNGTREGSTLFLFRDQIFNSLDEGISNQTFQGLYGVHNSFPFASLEGSFYTLPSEAYALNGKLERPVISVFEGVDVYFYSLDHLLETQIDWIENNVYPESDSSQIDLELPIWKSHNPGIFE